jgi:hypothetical protein
MQQFVFVAVSAAAVAVVLVVVAVRELTNAGSARSLAIFSVSALKHSSESTTPWAA